MHVVHQGVVVNGNVWGTHHIYIQKIVLFFGFFFVFCFLLYLWFNMFFGMTRVESVIFSGRGKWFLFVVVVALLSLCWLWQGVWWGNRIRLGHQGFVVAIYWRGFVTMAVYVRVWLSVCVCVCVCVWVFCLTFETNKQINKNKNNKKQPKIKIKNKKMWL